MVTHYGGVNEYGRSCFTFEMAGKTIMVDCGISKSAVNVPQRYPSLTKKEVQQVDAVLLTHAHEDHTLGLPYINKLGLDAPVFATSAVIRHTKMYFRLWRDAAETDNITIPYSVRDEQNLRFSELDHTRRQTWFELIPGVECMLGFSGHAPGSCWFAFRDRLTQRSLFFSGDYSMASPLLPYDLPPSLNPDFGVFDAAYGAVNSSQSSCIEDVFDRLAEEMDENRSVAFHVPFSGKGQDWLFLLASWCKDTDRTLAVEGFLIDETFILIEEKIWFNESNASKLKDMLSDPEVIQRDRRNGGKLFLITDDSLQMNTLDDEIPYTFMTTGPISPDLNRYTIQKKQQLIKMPFHVHPVLSESKSVFEQVDPKDFLLTHAPFNVTRSLEMELEKIIR